jgi:hypothetical protein
LCTVDHRLVYGCTGSTQGHMHVVHGAPGAHGVRQGRGCSFSLSTELWLVASELSCTLWRLSRAAKGLYGIAGSRRVHQGAKGGSLGLQVAGVSITAGLGSAGMMAGFLRTSTRLQQGSFGFLVLRRVQLGH